MAAKRKMTKKEVQFEERMKKQRARRGFSDRDVWSIDYWFYTTISPMLKQLAKDPNGFQPLDEKGNLIPLKDRYTKKEEALYMKRWQDAILHMAFLADEMNEETCSMKNPHDKEWGKVYKSFEKRYGLFGERLRTPDEEEKHFRRLYLPDSDPEHGKEYRKIMDRHSSYQRKIENYRNKCKNEFFRLFSKYFWTLWD